MKEEFRRSFLKDIKKLVSKGKFQLINRNKNVDFMKLYFLDDNDIRDIVLALTPSDCIGGPEPDRGGYEGSILEFKSTFLDNKLIYVKIRYCPPDCVVIISFHEDE